MKLDHLQLAALAAVVQEGSFELAAQRLHVTPSAISQRIKALEERLGQVLVLRTTPCRITEAGQPVLRYAVQLALLESEAMAALGVTYVEGTNAARSIRVPMVINADSFDSWFGVVFGALTDHPEWLIDIRVEDQDHSLALLRDGSVMAGVSAAATPVQGCRVEPLGVMRYRALAAPAYLARHFSEGLRADDLARAPMLAFNRKDALQDQFLLQLAGIAVRPPTHTAPTTQSFCEAIRRTLAWGMVPDQLSADDLASGQLVDLAPGRWLDVPLYWHRWRLDSRALDALTRYVRDAARQALLPPA